MDDQIVRRIAGRLNGLPHQSWCVMLVGLPGSGKTTFRHKLVAALDETPIVVSTDDIILETAQRTGKPYEQAFREHGNPDLGKSAYLQAQIARQHLYPLIIDQVNPTAKARRRKLRWLSDNYFRVGVYLEIDRELASDRITKRGAYGGASMDVHDAMAEVFVEPVADEFDEFFLVKQQPLPLS